MMLESGYSAVTCVRIKYKLYFVVPSRFYDDSLLQ